MKRAIVVAAVVVIACLTPILRAADAMITVQADKPGITVSPALYGIFFEEINRAGEGGLYAERVQNRSFEDSADEPRSWSFLKAADAAGAIAIDATTPLNADNRRSLRIENSRGRIGAANSGFGGIAIQSRQEYSVSLYARASEGFTGPITVNLENAVGRSIASARLEGLSPQWQKLTGTLKANVTDSDPAGRLVISTNNPGTVWIDVVSLFPAQTWKNRGLRPDLAQMIADLKPSFFRFPGGCWVEGETLEHSYRWKQTIGDVAQRANNYNLWKYHCTNALGYHEYLQFCEDIGADALFVINCGMSHKQNVPMGEIDPWVQDALDAIEYATGPADSTWGAKRVANGHPEPFKLKYLQVGNENGGRPYDERYALFYDAVKKRYPAIQIIANFWQGGSPRSRPIEILDEHYYNNPGFFISQANRYDRYDRKGPKIYVGEYACTRECGGGNLKAAIGEAAFMTGMERNSDIVVMSSYAPLMCNLSYKIWNPNAINFDATRSYGTPSYYVQQMFAQNRGEVILPLEMEFAGETPIPHGAIGLGAWNTRNEFKDIKVSRGEQTLLSGGDSLDGWQKLRGEWKSADGAIQQTAQQEDTFVIKGDPSWTDCTLTLKARKLSGREGFLIRFHSTGDNDYTMWNIGGFGNARHQIEWCQAGGKSNVGRSVNGRIEDGRWYEIKIELAGQQIKCYLDGELIHDVMYPKRLPLYGVAGRAGGDVVLKMVNVSAKPQEASIQLAGIGGVQPKMKQIVLTSGNPEDENSLESPTKVAPVTGESEIAGAKFTHTFPANSVTVLRVKPQ